MKTRAAVLMQAPGELQTAEVDLDEPRQGELLVRMVSSGLCHSDDHVAVGDLPVGTYPFCLGHEGAGVVEQVGRGHYPRRSGLLTGRSSELHVDRLVPARAWTSRRLQSSWAVSDNLPIDQ